MGDGNAADANATSVERDDLAVRRERARVAVRSPVEPNVKRSLVLCAQREPIVLGSFFCKPFATFELERTRQLHVDSLAMLVRRRGVRVAEAKILHPSIVRFVSIVA